MRLAAALMKAVLVALLVAGCQSAGAGQIILSNARSHRMDPLVRSLLAAGADRRRGPRFRPETVRGQP